MKICIDPGHGGKDPGAVSDGIREKDIALNIAMLLSEKLKYMGIDVFLTRCDDTYDSPNIKALKGNNSNADLFVSIHCNSAVNPTATGAEVLIYNYNGVNEHIADSVLDEMVKALNLSNRGIVPRKDLAVLRETDMTAILVETAFISNDNDRFLLTKYQQKFAEAIAKGICKFYGIKYEEDSQMTLEEAKRIIKEKCNFDDNTMKYLEFYRYSESMIIRLAEHMK